MAKRVKTAAPEAADAATAAVRSQTREAGSEAIAALLRLSCQSEAEAVRLAALKELLDRGFGRPAAAPGENGGGIIAHLLVDDGYAE